MPEYDAFGREIGEDTLGGLGGDASAPQPAPQPVPVPADDWTQPPPPGAAAPPDADAPPQVTFTIPGTVPTAIPGVRRRRGMGGIGCLLGLVILAVVVAGPVIAIVAFVGATDDAIDSVTGIIDDAIPAIDPPDILDRDDAPPPAGIAGRSMVAAGNFKGALARVDGLGKATLIRLSPDRAWFQLVKGGRQRGATVDYKDEFDRGTASAGGSPSTFALATVDAGAPARLVRGSAARFPALKAGRIDYLVAVTDPLAGGHRWLAYYKGGRGYVQGDARGRVERRFKP